MGWVIGALLLFGIIKSFCSSDTRRPDRPRQSGRKSAGNRHYYSAQPQKRERKAESYTPNIPHSSKYL